VGGYSFFLAFGFLAIRAGRSPLHCARNSASGRIASRISALEQSPLQHLYCPVFGATLKLRPSHTGQVYLFFPLPGSSLSKWSRMSNEFALDLSESSVKSDAKLPSVGYDVFISLSAHRMVSVKPSTAAVRFQLRAAVFGV
jgi:hypothetical protein